MRPEIQREIFRPGEKSLAKKGLQKSGKSDIIPRYSPLTDEVRKERLGLCGFLLDTNVVLDYLGTNQGFTEDAVREQQLTDAEMIYFSPATAAAEQLKGLLETFRRS